MGKIIDTRIIKKELRAKYRAVRTNMNEAEKAKFDLQIQQKFLACEMYKQARTLLCFVSTPLEVDTIPILQKAILDGKLLAVPKCLDKNGTMKFYIIKSLNDLEKSTFDLMEPNIKKCSELKDFRNSLCVLPGFAFDRDGYRIGFGKGYYDRFLNKYVGQKVAVCYNSCIAQSLPRSKYDVAADYIVTPKYILSTKHTKDSY